MRQRLRAMAVGKLRADCAPELEISIAKAESDAENLPLEHQYSHGMGGYFHAIWILCTQIHRD